MSIDIAGNTAKATFPHGLLEFCTCAARQAVARRQGRVVLAWDGDSRPARLASIHQVLHIVALTDRLELAPTVAEWLHGEFDHARGPSFTKRVAQLRAQKAPEETFVLYDHDVPVGTASLVINDLPSRPELTPWLAGVLIRPEVSWAGIQRDSREARRGDRCGDGTNLVVVYLDRRATLCASRMGTCRTGA